MCTWISPGTPVQTQILIQWGWVGPEIAFPARSLEPLKTTFWVARPSTQMTNGKRNSPINKMIPQRDEHSKAWCGDSILKSHWARQYQEQGSYIMRTVSMWGADFTSLGVSRHFAQMILLPSHSKLMTSLLLSLCSGKAAEVLLKFYF